MKKESAFHLTLLEDSDNGTEFSFGDKSNSDFLFTLDGLSAVLRKLQGKKTRRFLWVPKTTQIQLKYKDSVFIVAKKKTQILQEFHNESHFQCSIGKG